METFIATESEFEEHDEPLPEGVELVYFKLVGLGPNTMRDAERMTSKLSAIAREQRGFFFVGDGADMREQIHDLVDRFCDALEGKDESKS